MSLCTPLRACYKDCTLHEAGEECILDTVIPLDSELPDCRGCPEELICTVAPQGSTCPCGRYIA